MADINDAVRAGRTVGDVMAGEFRPVAFQTPVDLVAPRFSDLYTLAELRADLERKVLSMAKLPTKPLGGWDCGHGWGEAINSAIGGGITKGFMVAVGASSAGAGKTAFMMQLAEGLAARNLDAISSGQGPITPVLVLSEMPWRALCWRSMARHLSINYQVFRLGQDYQIAGMDRAATGDAIYPEIIERVENFLDGDGKQIYTFLRHFDASRQSGPSLIETAETILDAWVAELEMVWPGREIWPVLVLDPIQRFQDGSMSEVESLNQISEELLRLASSRGTICFLTSDTNKAAAKGTKDADPDGAGAFRGSYKLLHTVDVAMVLRQQEFISAGRYGISFRLVKNRWGGLSSFKGVFVPRYSRMEDIESQ